MQMIAFRFSPAAEALSSYKSTSSYLGNSVRRSIAYPLAWNKDDHKKIHSIFFSVSVLWNHLIWKVNMSLYYFSQLVYVWPSYIY